MAYRLTASRTFPNLSFIRPILDGLVTHLGKCMMKNNFIGLLLAFAVSLLLTSIPRISDAAGLGLCGSTATQRYLVPDGICVFPNGDIRLFACNMPHAKLVHFTNACEQHDSCYGAKGTKKSTCDTQFYKNLNRACRSILTNSFPEAGRKACFQAAATYNDKVRASGCPAFKGAQSARGLSNPQCN